MINSISNKFNQIIRLGKDKYQKNEKSHVVYKINCCDCDASYVGQTSRKLIIRSKDHASDCKFKRDRSVLHEHIANTNHKIDFNNIKILDQEQNLKKRLLSEMLHIHSQHNSLNRQFDTNFLKSEYKTFINNYKLF